MRLKRIDWSMVARALVPALAISILVLLVTQFLLGRTEAFSDRVAQLVFFPVFLGAYHRGMQSRLASKP